MLSSSPPLQVAPTLAHPSPEAPHSELIGIRHWRGWALPSLSVPVSLVLLATFVCAGLAQSLTLSWAFIRDGSPLPHYLPVFNQVSGGLATWLTLPLLLLVVVNAPSPRIGWGRFALAHVLGYLAFNLVQISVLWGLRWLGRGVFGLPRPSGSMLAQIAFEVQGNLLLYGAVSGALSVLLAWQEHRAALLTATRLDARLAETKLEALSARLDPHFLFNALNTISALMHQDLPRTERLLAGLGNMLRALLDARGPTWSLEEEWAHAQNYVDLLLARFGDRLHVRHALPSDLSGLQVPRFAIQTLVENAVKHNADRGESLNVLVRVERRATGLALSVEDDGRGFARDFRVDRHGRGLQRLAEVATLAFGVHSKLVVDPAGSQPTRVTLNIVEAPR
ncbi:MAG TPA: histidine kinase [Polyangiaceae bacterium]|nr:histidine kinase [Polyangiaceae bacterium]